MNADALAIAQKLADQGRCVGLVNGANRRMVGNHWFSHGARMAIEPWRAKGNKEAENCMEFLFLIINNLYIYILYQYYNIKRNIY